MRQRLALAWALLVTFLTPALLFVGTAVRRNTRLDPQTIRTVVATVHVGFGTMCLLLPELFRSNPSYQGMLTLGSPQGWGWMCVLLGVSLLLTTAHGRWSRFHMLLSVVMFSAISTTVTLPAGPNTATSTYALLGLFSFHAFVLGQVFRSARAP